jgi:glutathionylspermidine synthase
MKRHTHQPRADWQSRVEASGLSYHTLDGECYWQETAHYELSRMEIEILEETTHRLQHMAVEAAERAIRQGWHPRLGIPQAAWSEITASWERDDLSLYGRFDLLWDGSGSPKLLEYNADTPTSLLESAVTQWQWLQDRFPQGDQFNSIHEKLIASWESWPDILIHFTALSGSEEDWRNLLYLEDTCRQAGKKTCNLSLESLGWNRSLNRWVGAEEEIITRAFKLYPWEWMWQEAFSTHLHSSAQTFIEPVWKMLWSTKALLVLMWEAFPDHPNLLHASFHAADIGPDHAAKALHGREGANVSLFKAGQVIEQNPGPWHSQPRVYQKLHSEIILDGWHPVIGSWVIGGEAAGIGIREDRRRITSNQSCFAPHRFLA